MPASPWTRRKTAPWHLQLARSRRYDLILMDMRMPNLNGVDATAGNPRRLLEPRHAHRGDDCQCL
jgi:CheY-like chemotaxis protein